MIFTYMSMCQSVQLKACDCGQTYLASAKMQHASFWRQGSASLVATVFAMALWLGELLVQQLRWPFPFGKPKVNALFQPSWVPRFHYQEEWSMVQAGHHVWPRRPRWWSQGQAQKKRRVTKQDPSSEVVEVPLNGTSIQCLMHGQKPTLSDVVIPLAKEQLEPFFVLLQSNQESLESRKPYKMAAKQS